MTRAGADKDGCLPPVIRKSRITGPHTRNPPEIPDSCLPAGLREFARVCTGPKRLTEDPVLWSTIRHQKRKARGNPGFFLACSARSGVLVVPAHDPLLLALPVAFLRGVALVVLLLALGQGDLQLDLVALPVHRGGHDGVAVALDAADQLVDLVPVQQQLAGAAVV